jgi:hypothetical protein
MFLVDESTYHNWTLVVEDLELFQPSVNPSYALLQGEM